MVRLDTGSRAACRAPYALPVLTDPSCTQTSCVRKWPVRSVILQVNTESVSSVFFAFALRVRTDSRDRLGSCLPGTFCGRQSSRHADCPMVLGRQHKMHHGRADLPEPCPCLSSIRRQRDSRNELSIASRTITANLAVGEHLHDTPEIQCGRELSPLRFASLSPDTAAYYASTRNLNRLSKKKTNEPSSIENLPPWRMINSHTSAVLEM